MQGQKRYLYYLNDPSFQGVKTFFVLSFENCTSRRSYKQYYFPRVEKKD